MADNNQQGFQNMSEDKRRDIAAKGGHAAQSSGRAHQLTDEERSRGGRESGGNFANDPERASEAGREGGKQSRRNA